MSLNRWLHTASRPLRAPWQTKAMLLAGGAIAALSVGFTPGGSEAAGPLTVPACGSSQAAANTLSSAVPLTGQASPPPAVGALTAVVIDGETGRVLYDKHAHDRIAPASTTKIMTGLLAAEYGNANQVITSDIDGRAMTGSSIMGLRVGEQINLQSLLYGLMLPSGNDAAVEIAKTIDGSEPAFVAHMNRRAAELGLHDTHFMNPHGLDDPQHYSSAYDLTMLSRYAMGNPQFAKVVGTQDYFLPAPAQYNLHNGNTMLSKYPGADGVKIGWTDNANWTMVASATRDGRRVFVAVMNTQDRDADASALLDWAWQSHQWAPVTTGAHQTLNLAREMGIGGPLLRATSEC